MKRTAYIALGSNLGDSSATLMEAVKRMDGIDGVCVRRVSQMIQTEPVGPAGQPEYLNGAAEIETTLQPRELLAALQKIESALGRDRTCEQRFGPRTCDLDILLVGDLVMETEELTIPHLRMHERLFVLRPLAEIAPQTVHSKLGRTISDLLAELEAGE